MSTTAQHPNAQHPTVEPRPLRTAIRIGLVDSRRRLVRPWLIVLAVAAVFFVIVWFFRLVFGLPTGWETQTVSTLATPGYPFLLVLFVALSYAGLVKATLPFAQHLGMTRQNFSAATGLIVLGETLLHAVAMTVLNRVGQATGGWGIGATDLFSINPTPPNPLGQLVLLWAVLAALGFLALAVAALRHRFGMLGVWVFWGAALAVLVVGFTQGYLLALVNALADVTFAAVVGTFLALAVASAGLGFLVLRRAPAR